MHTKLYLEKCEGKRSLMRPRRAWEDKIEVDNKEQMFVGADQVKRLRIDWAPVNMVLNFRFP
jgi:hypothetical protein